MFCFALVRKSACVKIIFDTDMLTDCDDTAALGILHKLADAGETEILATMVTSSYPMSAPVVDVINTYYNRPDIPIGVPKKVTGFIGIIHPFWIRLRPNFRIG